MTRSNARVAPRSDERGDREHREVAPRRRPPHARDANRAADERVPSGARGRAARRSARLAARRGARSSSSRSRATRSRRSRGRSSVGATRGTTGSGSSSSLDADPPFSALAGVPHAVDAARHRDPDVDRRRAAHRGRLRRLIYAAHDPRLGLGGASALAPRRGRDRCRDARQRPVRRAVPRGVERLRLRRSSLAWLAGAVDPGVVSGRPRGSCSSASASRCSRSAAPPAQVAVLACVLIPLLARRGWRPRLSGIAVGLAAAVDPARALGSRTTRCGTTTSRSRAGARRGFRSSGRGLRRPGERRRVAAPGRRRRARGADPAAVCRAGASTSRPTSGAPGISR